MEKSAVISVRLPAALKTAATKKAQADGRNLNNWICKLITDATKEGKK